MTATLVPCPGPLVDTVVRSIAQLRAGAPGTEAKDWAPVDRESALAALDGAVQELTIYRGQVLLAHQRSGKWGSTTDRDFADYRSRTTGSGRGAALGDLRLAEGLDQLPVVAEAVERGDLSLEHAKTLTRLHEKGSQEVKDALADGGLQRLVERASNGKLSAPDLGKEGRAWAAKIDAAAAQKEFDAVRRRRSFTMRRHAGGMAGEFFLDPVAGEQVRTALEAISGTPAAQDERTREQRMADALTTLAGRALQVGADQAGAQVRPHISLLVAEETWVGIQARRRRFASCPDGPRPPWPNVPAGQLEDGTPVPLGELERLMCDCETTRVVLDAKGVPLDVGQTERTYTKELRRAVLTRDRHCQWPECRMRATWCEVHHILYYSRGGPTSLANGITLCSYHHHVVHQRYVRITPLDDGFDFHHVDGGHIGTTRRSRSPGALLPCPSTAPAASSAAGSDGSPPSGQPQQPDGPAAQTGDRGTTPSASPRGRPEGTALPSAGSGDVRIRPSGPSPKQTGPTAPRRSTRPPGHRPEQASAPTLWDADPPG